ncbi:MAG: hypothetical protein OEY14_06940, partial [Myxococcales bacterium]|nr:hypothetical protein [Myxococcales bacterium]
ESLRDALLWRVGILCPLAALLYFVTPASYDWIWPINARFPLLALLFLVPLLPWTKGPRALALFASLSLLSAASFHQVGEAFQRFEAEEVGDLEGAIEVIPEGSKVVGLIFDRGSEQVRFSPFIHSAAWVQTRRGGAAMFTFADFPQSPVRFREANRPPRVGPRWEWMPERVNPDRDLGWYEYALVRGGPGLIARSRSFEPIHRSARWSVWRRVPED